MVVAIISAIVALIVGYLIKNFQINADKQRLEKEKLKYETKVKQAELLAKDILERARRDAKILKEQILFKANQKALTEAKKLDQQYRKEIESEYKERNLQLNTKENLLNQREEILTRKDDTLMKREFSLEDKEHKLISKQQLIDEREKEVKSLEIKQQIKIERIANLSREDAQDIIIKSTKEELDKEISIMIKKAEERIKEESDKKAKNILSLAMQRASSDYISENTVSVVQLPNDDIKGRIIGREGRNIRTLESLTGINIVIDDTPEAVVLSGFDPIRREIARMTLEKLIQDGRIHPARIEEIVEKSRKDMDSRIRSYGEAAAFKVGAHTLHPDLIKIMGRLHFRTSYGQNVLAHSVEVAYLTGALAGELGENISLAKRAGFLHDIGKALDYEIEGSHVEIGAQVAAKYKENPVIVNAISSHHGDVEATSIIAILVSTADVLSAARPGARSESLESYTHRLQTLEAIGNGFTGVEKTYAIQAGREVRVIVKPEEIDDLQAVRLSHDLRKKIENELDYPGSIKITVVREMRVVEYAK
ncbi:MAG: ribonuclease Y [Streptococcaceae bacterium]|nr:ribonuclease Y [Streptococcaceae bacterium]